MSAQQSPIKPLSPIAQQVAECYAVIYPESPARTHAMKWLNVARRATSAGGGLKSTDVSQAIDELASAGLIEPSIESQRGVSARGPKAMLGTITRFCEGALQRGTYAIILRELDNSIFRPSYLQSQSTYPHERLSEQYARFELISNKFDNAEEHDLPMHIWLWLSEPRAKKYLERLPQPHLSKACIYGMSYLVHHLLPFDVFAKTCDSVNPDGNHQVVTARGRIYQGNFTQARKLIEAVEKNSADVKRDRVECSALRALMAELEGDDEAAMAQIETTLEIERSGTRKRIVYADSLSFGMSLFSLLRLGTVESKTLFKSIMEARVKLRIESDLDWPLDAAISAELSVTPYRPQFVPGEPTIIGMLFAITSRWHSDYHYQQDHKSILRWLDTIKRQAQNAQYHWVAAEVQAVMEVNFSSDELRDQFVQEDCNEITSAKIHEKLGTTTLTKLVTALEPWEYSLRELEQLAHKASPGKAVKENTDENQSRRLVWQLVGIYGGAVNVTPLEQSANKKGQWSGGRRVALKRLREQADTLPHLSAQDVKASATIQKLDHGWKNSTYETDQRTVFQLAGHPYVYDKHGERVDVVERQPVLEITEHNLESNSAQKLTITPEFNGAYYQSFWDKENQRVYVTYFTLAHRRIAQTLPPAGLLVPERAKSRVKSILDGLSSDISVQGDSLSASTELQAGVPDPVLSMEPSGQSLRVRIRVEPLPESGSFFDAGTGGAVVYVQSADGTITVQRNLIEERTQVEAIVLQSSVLAEYYDGRSFFVIDNTVDALELLEELQQAGVRCIWPSDIPFRIKATADISQVRLNLKSAKEWFSATGTLSVNDEDDEPISLARLLHLMKAQPQSRFIELGKGEFLSLSRTLKQQLDTLQAFAREQGKDTDTHKIHPMALLSLDPLLNNATVKSDKSWKDRRQQISDALKSSAPVPASLQAELRTYQYDGFAWLERLGQIGAGACLADDMGLGKTVQSLALFLARAERGPSLVVAPTSVVGNWLAEAQRFAPSLNVIAYANTEVSRQEILENMGAFDLLIVSYGLMVNDIEPLQKIHWHTIVLDEAQAIKNASTRRAKCAQLLQADFRVVTTGTPVQNNLMDLHSLFSFLNPQLLGSESAFRKRFALPISRDNDEYAREQLQKLVSPFLLRRHKRDVLKELPARTELNLNVALSKEESALYEMIRQEALDSLEEASGDSATANKKNDKALAKQKPKPNIGQQKMIILSYLTKLRRLCCNPSLIAPDWAGPMSKLDLFSDTISELIESGHKALVFSQFVDHLKIVEKHLKNRSINYQYLDGSTTAKQRTDRVNAFQSGVGDVFLISLTAGGTGLNLTAADYVIHLDPWWNPAVEDQASDRAHRIGQQRPVTIVRMVTTGTIEEQIQELHATKRDLADSVLAGADTPKLDIDAMVQLLKG